MAFLPYAMHDLHPPSFVFIIVHHKVSRSYISRMVWPRITKCHTEIHTDSLCRHIWYDVKSYFQSALIEVWKKNGRKCRLWWFWVEFRGMAFCLAQPIVGLLFALCYDVICSPITKWAACISQEQLDLDRITKFYMDIHTDQLYSHTGYDVTSYFRLAAKIN